MEATAKRRPILRYLRITFSAGCGMICLLLIALWMRSYWWNDIVTISFDGNRGYIVRSVNGGLEFLFSAQALRAHGPRWFTEPAMGEPSPPSFLGFRWGVDRGLRWPVVPQWLPVVLTAILAALPWMKQRFSLRTLLIATTVVAAILGIIVISN